MASVESIVRELRHTPFPQNLYEFDLACGFTPHIAQFATQVAMIAYEETGHCWGRQMGKTLWNSLTSEFMSVILGMRGAYRTPQEGQCEAPLEYWLSTPFCSGTSNGWVKFMGKKKVHLAPITNNNMRSKTLDYVIFDEEAGCTKKQDLLVDVGNFMVQNSPRRRIIHISTPLIGTKFETTFNRLEPLGFTTRRTYRDFLDTQWIQPAYQDILKKKKLVEEGHYPRWLFLQEVDGMFAAQGGSIFSDYTMGTLDIPENSPEWMGIDINPKAGHTALIAHYLPPNILYFKEQIDLGTNTEQAALVVKNRMRWNTHVEFELNGAGEEAVKVFNKILNADKGYLGKFIPQLWDDQLKFNRIMQMIASRIIVNPKCKDFYNQLRSASWNPNVKLQPMKGPDDHWIDAGYHAARAVSVMNPQSGYKVLATG